MDTDIRQLHDVLLDLIGFFNQPQRDAALIQEAGISLDRALFPLLVRIERRGPMGIVELAGLAGRDYTTVSRQVSKLESLGLVHREPNPRDGRISDVVIAQKGKAMTDALDAARERLAGAVFSTWNAEDRTQLIKLLRRLVDDVLAASVSKI